MCVRAWRRWQDNTEYRYEYQRKRIAPCVAGVLQGGGRCGGQPMECFDFVETDAMGHDWYQRAAAAEDGRREAVPVS